MFQEPKGDPRKWFILPDLEIKESKIPNAGLGVFAINDIPARTIIEKSPVVITSNQIFDYLEQDLIPGVRNVLCDYAFGWEAGTWVWPLGWGGIYNHSFDANVKWSKYIEEGSNSLVYTTKRDIKAGEELFVRYCWTSERLWFADDSVDMGHWEPPNSPGISFGMSEKSFLMPHPSSNRKKNNGNIETLASFKKKKEGDK